jgi:tRNA dimethylallyltransferase
MAEELKTLSDLLINNSSILVIGGPTASGKTGIALELSKHLNIEIISADSRQVYKYLDIGTAKPSKEELAKVPHHFIDFLEPNEYFSAGLFENLAEKKILEIYSRNSLPVVVGGTGFYIKALCEGLFDFEVTAEDFNTRNLLNDKYKKYGIEVLYDELLNIDKDSAEKYSDKNPRRVIRALEYYYLNGIQLSKVWQEEKLLKSFKPIYFARNILRSELYSVINNRTDEMWKNGLLEETKKVLEMGFDPSQNALNTVGYKETIAYINKQIDEKTAIEEIKKNTRRYAKRQMTWFKGINSMKWLSGNIEEITLQILDISKAEILENI